MSNTVFIFELGVVSYNNHNYDSALGFFRTCVKRDEKNWEAQLFLAMTLVQKKRYQEAMSIYDLLAACPDHSLRQRAILAQIALQSLIA